MTIAGVVERIVKRPRRWDDYSIERKKWVKRQHRLQAGTFTARLRRAGLYLTAAGTRLAVVEAP